MLIVLDTNIIVADPLIRTSAFQILLDFAARTESRIVMPRLVLEEIAANYERNLIERLGDYNRAGELLNGISVDLKTERVTVDIEAAVARYVAYVTRKLGVLDETVIEYGEPQLRDAIGRSVQRRPPCHVPKKVAVRDAIIWNCVLTLKEPEQQVVFISNDTDFAKNQKLHPDLEEEAAAVGLDLEYLQSLEEFAKKHASPIAFITDEWIASQIHEDDLLESIRDTATDYARGVVLRGYGTFLDGVDEFRIGRGSFEPDEYFVNNMQDGDKRLHCEWYGHVEVEYRIRTYPTGLNYGFDHTKGESGYTPYEEVDVSATLDLTASVVTSAVVRDGKVVEWGVLHVNLRD